MNKKPKKQLHNIGTHAERMALRRQVQRNRVSTTYIKTGKYTPSVEDKKHLEG